MRMRADSVDPRIRVLYLAAIAVGAFLVKDARVACGLAAVHAIAWLALGLGPRALARQVFKLWGFAAFVTASYALTSEAPGVDRWIHVDLGFARLPTQPRRRGGRRAHGPARARRRPRVADRARR